MTVFATLALLQAAGGASSMLPLVFQFAAIFAIFYFIMIRPQQKQRKDHESRLRSLKRGDEIVTQGGIVGRVVHIKESSKDGAASPSMDDHITIASGESRLVIERGRIAKVAGDAAPAPAKNTSDSAS
jgi:preprotein translocase subunit YajC